MSERSDTGQEWSDKYEYWFECLGKKEKERKVILKNVTF